MTYIFMFAACFFATLQCSELTHQQGVICPFVSKEIFSQFRGCGFFGEGCDEPPCAFLFSSKAPATLQDFILSPLYLNCCDEYGLAPIHYAVIARSPQRLKKILSHRGVDLALLSNKGRNALHYAAVYFDTDEEREKSQPQEVRESIEGIIKCLVESANSAYPLIDSLTSDGQTALHLALETGNFAAIQALLERGASVSIPDSRGLLPLHLAVKNTSPFALQLLLQAGAVVDARTRTGGETALIMAIDMLIKTDEMVWRTYCEDVVRILLHYGADIYVTADDGTSAADQLRFLSRTDSAKLFSAHS